MAASAGDAGEAEEELCRRFAPRVRLYGLRHLPEPSSADDLVQRVLGLAITKLRSGEVREPDRIASFILGVARMQAREMRRPLQREQLLSPEDGEHVPAEAVPEPRPLATERLSRCLEALGGRERTVVLLSFFDEQGAGEIAEALGTTPGNVRVIRHRAVEHLRQCMGLAEEPTS